MLAANLFSLLINLTCVGVVVYVIYLVLRGKPRTEQSHQSTGKSVYTLDQKISISSFIAYLKALKEEGKSSIDDVLKDLAGKLSGTKSLRGEKTISQVSKAEEKEKQVEVPVSVQKPIDSANLLLYLGAFVFLFAMLIFAGFTWSIYSVGFKVALILLVPIVFFVVGYAIRSNQKFQTAASLFQVISAVTIGLAGVGIWNFTEISDSVSFWGYWLWYSFFVVFAYSGFLLLFKERKYRYFVLAAVFSLITSVAYAYANTPELRLLVIALLNVALYGVVHVFSLEEDKIIVQTITVVNRILDISIFLTLLGADRATDGLQQVVVVLALLVPWGYEVYHAVKTRNDSSSHIGLLAVVPKIFVLTRLFGADASLTMQLLAVSSVTVITLTELLLDESHKVLRGSSRLFHSIVLGFLSVLVIKWESFLIPGIHGESLIRAVPLTDVLFITLAASVGYVMPLRNEFHKPRFGFALLPLMFGIAGLLPYTQVITGLAILAAVSIAAIFVMKNESEYEKFSLISVSESSLLFSAWLCLVHGSSLQNGLLFFVVAVGVVITRKLLQSKNALLLVAPFLFISAVTLGSYVQSHGILSEYSIVWVLPILFYGTCLLLPMFEQERGQGKFFFLLFAIVGALVSGDEYGASIMYLLTIVGFSSANIARTTDKTWGAVLGVAALLLGRSFVKLIGLPTVMVYFADAGIVLVGMSALTLLHGENHMWRERLEYLRTVLVGYVFVHFFYGITAAGDFNSRSIGLIDYSPVDTKYILSIQGELFLAVLGVITSAYALYIGPVSTAFRRFSGFGLVIAAWILAGYYDANLQFYIVPFTAYLGIQSYLAWTEKNSATSSVLEIVAIVIQGMSLFLQSTTSSSDVEKIQYGIALIAVSLTWIIIGNRGSRKGMYVLGLLFLILELLVRLWVVIVLIPWWVYLAIIGLVLMGAGLYSVWSKQD